MTLLGAALAAAVMTQTAVAGNVSIELSVQTLDGAAAPIEGRDLRLRVRLRDAKTDAPLRSAPAAWIAPPAGGSCASKAEAFLGDSLLARPELELDALLVVALNEDTTITVLDAEGGFGGSRLVALVELPARGGDWALAPDGDRLFVTIPSLGRVVAVDTATWRIAASADVGGGAGTLALQPDGAYVWIATAGGVVVLRARDLSVAGRPVRGAGPFAIAFAEDSTVAFVAGGDTVSLVHIATLQRHASTITGGTAAGIAYSPLARAACVVHTDGTLALIGRERGEIAGRAATEAGAAAIAFAPGGRLAFVANRDRDRVHVFDAASSKIVRAIDVDGGPERIVFSDALAYFQPSRGEFVNMLPVDGTKVWSFPIGRTPAKRTGAAAAIAHAGGGTLFVAHPGDAVIYVYREGMAAPSGALRNDRRAPLAVLAVRRRFRERQPGVFETVVRLPAAGPRELTLFVPDARVAHCFALDVAPDPRLPRAPAPSALVEPAVPVTAPAGRRLQLRFRVVDRSTRAPLRDVDDLVLLIMRAPGVWFERVAASMETPGTYVASVLPPAEGIYYVYIECPSRGIALGGQHAAAFVATRG